MIKWFKYGLTIIIICSIGFFVAVSDWRLIFEQLSLVGWGFSWLMLISLLGYFLGSLSWKYCFKNTDEVHLKDLFFVRTIGENIAVINPTSIIAGEATKMHLMKSTLQASERLNSIIISRVVMITTQIGLSLLCVIYLMQYMSIGDSYKELLGFGLLALIGIFSVLYFFLRLSSNVSFLKTIREQVRLSIESMCSFFREHKKKTFLAILFAILHWCCGAMEFYYILHYLNIDLGAMACLTIDMGIVILKSLAGFIPGQIGVEELGNKAMLSLTGVQSGIVWISVSVLRRCKQLTWLAVSFLFYVFIKFSTKSKSKHHGSIIYNA